MSSGSIHVALLRVRELSEPWSFPYGPKYGGCRSWVDLPEPPDDWEAACGFAMGDDDFATLADSLERILA
jgi:hypothetical protein